jgi:hypothetical protein
VQLLPFHLLIRWVRGCKTFDALLRIIRTLTSSSKGSESAEGPTASLFSQSAEEMPVLDYFSQVRGQFTGREPCSPIRGKLHPQPHVLPTSVADQSIFQTA